MATATKQDDDLLIITEDDSSQGSDDISFSFDVASEEESTSEKIDLTAVDTTTTQEDTIVSTDGAPTIDLGKTQGEEKQVSDKNETSKENAADTSDVSFSLDLDETPKTSEETPEMKVSPVEETKKEDFSLGLDLQEDTPSQEASQEISEKQLDISNETTSEQSSGESLNDILAGTIAKLEARKESIASDKATKTSKEEEIKSEIKKLEDEYSKLEAEMKALDAESEKITANITELEKMKLDPVKEHNAKRVVKK